MHREADCTYNTSMSENTEVKFCCLHEFLGLLHFPSAFSQLCSSVCEPCVSESFHLTGGRTKPTLVVPRDAGIQAAPSLTLASSLPGCTIERGRLEFLYSDLRTEAIDVILISFWLGIRSLGCLLCSQHSMAHFFAHPRIC